MILFPAIDLKDGQCVRLKLGDMEQATVFNDDPAAQAKSFEDQGFDGTGRLAMACDGDPCLRPEGRITMEATVVVPLPLVPAFARDVVPLEVPVTASHVAVVDRFRGSP